MSTQTISPVFCFQSHQIRTTIINNQPWFVAKDVSAALGIQWTGHVLGSVPSDWQGVVKLTTPHKGGSQKLRIISEPAVYKLAFRSNKPEADTFTNWVASDVLPTIRKTGKYEVQSPRPLPLPAITATPDSRLSKRTDKERKALTALVNTWVGQAPIHYAAAWVQVNAKFGVASVDDLTIAEVKEALKWVQGKIDALPKALPQEQPPAALPSMQEIDALFADVLAKQHELHHWALDMSRRFSRIAGPLYIDVCRALPYPPRNLDPGVECLHGLRYEAFRKVQDGMNDLYGAVRYMQFFALCLGGHRA